MRQVTANEILALNKFLQMETNSLSMAKVGINVISDPQLKTLAQSGISATEGRIRGIQQFITENNITSPTTTHIVVNPSINNKANSEKLDMDLPKGVM
jgi:ferritin-like metal-binding protein YciE